MMKIAYKNRGCAGGMSLVELLVAIGILGVAMTLIGAAFPAGVIMSIAVSDESTSQTVFQKAVAEIKGKLNRNEINPTAGNPLEVVDYDILGGTEDEILESRRLSDTGPFSWAALVRPVDAVSNGPMGNLCQVVVVVSRQKYEEDAAGDPILPELQSVNCTESDPTARTLTVANADFAVVPNGGYIIDSATGTAYVIISRNENDTVTVLAEPPLNSDIGTGRDFWVVPGPYDGTDYGPKSPAIRVFQAMLYLP